MRAPVPQGWVGVRSASLRSSTRAFPAPKPPTTEPLISVSPNHYYVPPNNSLVDCTRGEPLVRAPCLFPAGGAAGLPGPILYSRIAWG